MTDRAGGDGPRGEDATGDDRPDLSGQDPAEAFGRLFDQHARPLHRYLARRVGEHVADDLVAETFLVALRQRHDYDPARAPVRAWLFGIATNLLRRHVRQEIRGFQVTAMVHGRAEAERPEPPETRAIERVDAEERTRRLAEALGQMAQGDRDVLLLTSWGDMDSNEVAAALGIPVGTVRSRLHRVRRWLRAGGGTQGRKKRTEDGHA
ncbi:RNA polymerase sigma-70 factor, ECF subfamily [Streptoalloteichus tenebrarius]|uniref:RNA polymerase sigma-70 factor, ECF subfamily n=1 Tax=Streptoalloteichus tenebrarius (strain ATCC 17920 / DSM 40477 / JCM 4838 / CBS 697.72 / NBRC 16177 / NCIMB 11028 / NRRL B-12390 / A12253. 1 / ISP 5477) TaxID=1933 RepID=A0ABT1I3C6_STRSD|nr:sigma-70 family RNA polymerase sigma factor [Streptoalloteichus tenebrarius]MCP2262264.1 RNA polymerase sigma-70 factor, ECF subfamily [Streptoalloteichus tenebrarius]